MIEAWTNFRAVDVVDIIVVGIFIYSILVWFRKARSRFVLIGLALMTCVYFVARLLDMQLTLLLFQAGLAIALISVVIIFQDDIRRAFERIATGSSLIRRKGDPGSDQLIETLVESVDFLAKQKIGALIVLRGKEPLERNLTGGVTIDGQMSSQLLLSIFDPHSAGHDGAVVIEDGRIRSFSEHLPLSTSVDEKKQFGTRHTAALGLSERSDALIIVVSEERGEISIARDGKIELIESLSLLHSKVEVFFNQISPETRQNYLQRLAARNWGAKAMSLIIALAAWFVLFGDQGETVARTFSVPIGVHSVPENLIIEEPLPHEARVTLMGSKRSFSELDPSQMMISVNIENLSAGNERIPLGSQDFHVPDGFSIHRIEPLEFSLKTYQALRHEVQINPKVRGRLAKHLKIGEIKPEPSKVTLIIPKRYEKRIRWISTEPVDLESLENSIKVPRRLLLPKNARLADESLNTVDVYIEVLKKKSTIPDADRENFQTQDQ